MKYFRVKKDASFGWRRSQVVGRLSGNESVLYAFQRGRPGSAAGRAERYRGEGMRVRPAGVSEVADEFFMGLEESGRFCDKDGKTRGRAGRVA